MKNNDAIFWTLLNSEAFSCFAVVQCTCVNIFWKTVIFKCRLWLWDNTPFIQVSLVKHLCSSDSAVCSNNKKHLHGSCELGPSASLWSSVLSQTRSGCSVRSRSFPQPCTAARPAKQQPPHSLSLKYFVHLSEFYCKSFHIPLRLSGCRLPTFKDRTEPVQT